MDTVVVSTSPRSPTQARAQPPLPTTTGKRKRTRQHPRNYQACNLCRVRKIRCDLGNSEDPQPPCARCRREQKECVFESGYAVRRGRPPQQHSLSSASPLPQEEDRDAAGNGHKRGGDNEYGPTGRASAYAHARIHRGAAVPDGLSDQNKTHSTRSFSPRAPFASLVDSNIRDDTDALHLLFDTALQTDSRDDGTSGNAQNHYTKGLSEHQRERYTGANGINHPSTRGPSEDHVVPYPELSGNTARDQRSSVPADPLSVWAYFLPCQQQYLSPAEAMAYLEYFFSVLNKQMPILSDSFQDPQTHQTLLVEDPILCFTMLAIASRYHHLPGHNGHSRGYLLHDVLFRHVQEGLQQILWGCSLRRQSGMTVIGAIESLLLLTQWHPRSLYLPASVTTFSNVYSLPASMGLGIRHHDLLTQGAIATASRSDNMCWMFAGLAVNLANGHAIYSDQHLRRDPESFCFAGDLRIPHIKKMLYIYTTGLATRLKRPSPFGGISVLELKQDQPEKMPERHRQWHRALNAWIELIELGSMASDLLHASPQSTRDLIKTGKYKPALGRFDVLLSQWWTTYQAIDVPPAFRSNFEIEYHYLRIVVYSIAIQAVVERALQLPAWRTTFNLLGKGTKVQTSSDAQMLQEVTDSCCRIFELVVELHQNQSLRGVTAPLLLRIVTASMVGLKIVALSLEKEDHLVVLLDQVISVLQQSAVDDIHAAGHYARLLDISLKRLKQRSSEERASLDGSTFPATQDEQQRNTSGGPQMFDAGLYDIATPAPDWNDLLAFQFDPTFATLQMGFDGDFFSANAFAQAHTPSAGAEGV